MRISFANFILGVAICVGLVAGPAAGNAADEKKVHRLAVQISTNDPATMNLTLNNVVNVAQEYSKDSQEFEIEVVAYGSGLHMLRDDTSPVKARVKSIVDSVPGVTFTACGNTKDNMAKAEGKEIVLVPQAKLVKAGVVRLMQLQESGWSYIRP